MGKFVLSFARRNELYADCPLQPLTSLRPGPRGEAADWAGQRPVIMGGARPTSRPGADVERVYAAVGGERLWVRIELRAAPSPTVAYRLYLHALAGGAVGPPITCKVRDGRAGRGAAVRTGANWLEISLPAPRGLSGLMLEVETEAERRVLQRTPWVMLLGADRWRHLHSPGRNRITDEEVDRR